MSTTRGRVPFSVWTSMFVVALALGAGCAGNRAPTFTVTDAALARQSESASVILVTIEGENPNPDPLPLYSVRYSASMGDTEVFHAERSPQRTIPRFSRASFTVPVVVPNDRLPTGIGEIALRGSVVYQVPGTIAEVFFDTNIRRPSAPVSGEATVNLGATVPGP